MSIVRTATNPKVIGMTIACASIGALGVICAGTKKALAEDIGRAKGGPDSANCNTKRNEARTARAKKFNVFEGCRRYIG